MARSRVLNIVIAGDADKLDHETKRANKSLASLGKQSSATSRVTAAGFTAIGTAAVGGLGYAIKSAMSFEKQMSALGAVSDATGKQMEQFRKQAMKAGRDTAFSAREAAVAQTELAKGGLSVANIMKGGLNSALALAAAGELELSDAAAVTANAMNLFQINGRDSAKVADALATAANATTADVADFGMALKQGGAVAKSAGFSFEQTVVALEALAASGIKNSDAGTSLKTALIQLIRPTNEQAKLAEALGLSFLDASGNMKSLGDISAMLRSRLGDQTAAQRTATLATLAGTDGVRTLTALYDAGPAKLSKWERGVRETGTAADVARRKQDNLAGAVEQLKGSAETLAISVGTELIPELTKGARAATRFVNQMQDGTGAGGRFVRTLKDIWESVRPIVTAMGRAARAVGQFAAQHPGLVRLAASIAAVGVAVRALRFVSAVSGFSALLKGGRVAAAGLRRIFATAGTTAGEAAAASAATGWRGKVAGFGRLGRAAGLALGKGVAAGIVLAIPLIAVQLRNLLQKFQEKVTGGIFGGESLGHKLGSLLGTNRGKQTGGLIEGSGRGDIVPAMLEPGEFVIQRRVVDKFGPTFFASLNGGMGTRQGQAQVPGFTSGGIVSRANKMANMGLPYLWGGGHGGSIKNGVDCSGAVSWALGVSPRVSGAFAGFGQPGPGSPNDTKIYANAKHVFAVFNGRGWGTSREHPGGGPGWLSYSHRPGFTIRHLNDSGASGGTRGDPQETAETGKQRRIAREERAGSRAVNRLASRFGAGPEGFSRMEKLAGIAGRVIEDKDTAYGQLERRFGQSEEDLGTAAGKGARISELAALAVEKRKQLQRQKKRAGYLRQAISKLEGLLKAGRKQRDRSKGARRAKISERLKGYEDRLADLKAESRALGFQMRDTELDIGDLAKEAREVTGTPDTAAEEAKSAAEEAARNAPTVVERVQDLLSLIDLRERAGLLSAGDANAQRQAVIAAGIQGKFGATTEREQLQLMGDLREAQEAGVAAVEDNTSALRDLQKSIDDQTAFARSVVATENASLVKSLADIVSGQIAGFGVAGRALMPGASGLRARY